MYFQSQSCCMYVFERNTCCSATCMWNLAVDSTISSWPAKLIALRTMKGSNSIVSSEEGSQWENYWQRKINVNVNDMLRKMLSNSSSFSIIDKFNNHFYLYNIIWLGTLGMPEDPNRTMASTLWSWTIRQMSPTLCDRGEHVTTSALASVYVWQQIKIIIHWVWN